MNAKLPEVRIIREIDPELEWKYLVNETLVGERCIVPLLQTIAHNPKVQSGLKKSVLRQIEEEAEHVRLYHNLVGRENLHGTGFDRHFSAYVKSLPTVTLQLFALQALLEGIALGALEYRITHWKSAPSYETDLRAFAEETDHVTFSFDHFKSLIEADGVIPTEKFRTTAKHINSIFTDCFSGHSISTFILKNYNLSIEPKSIESSKGILALRTNSSKTIVKTKRNFEEQYRYACSN
jgi:hypothetical protein